MFRRILLSVRHSRDVLAVAFLALCPLALYWPVALGQEVFFADDLFRQSYPFHVELARALAQGRLPLWSPGLGSGFPLFADGFVAALYPLSLALFRGLPVENALSYFILFHLFWAATGMFLLVRSLDLRIASALLAALSFGFCGYAIAQISHVDNWAVVAWLPWMLLFQCKYWRDVRAGKPGWSWFAFGSLAIGLQFMAGQLQMALLNLAAFAAFGVAGPFVWGGFSWREGEATAALLARSTLVTVVSLALGFGVAAVQLAPTLELAGFSVRGRGMSEAFFLSYSLDPAALSQFVLPFWQMGPPSTANLESWAYIGVVPLVLALAAPFLRRDLKTRFFLVFGVVALLMALGASNPAYRMLYHVPWFNDLRVPARFLGLFSFAAALLAAIGLEELSGPLRETRSEMGARALVVLFALGSVGLIVLRGNEPPEFWMRIWVVLPAVWLTCAAGLLIAAWRKLLGRALFATAAVGITILDLIAFSIPFSAASSPSLLDLADLVSPSELTEIPRSVTAMDQSSPLYRVLAKEFLSVSIPSVRAALWPDLALAQGLQGVQAYSSLALGRNDEYVHAMSAGMIDLIGARYFLVPVEATANTPSPLDDSEPEQGLSIDLLRRQPQIPPTPTSLVEITSYADGSASLAEGTLAGQLILGLSSGSQITVPIRLGYDTADWTSQTDLPPANTPRLLPVQTLSFPAYLSSLGHSFEGHKYVAQYQTGGPEGPAIVTSVGAESFLPDGGLSIEHVALEDAGRSVSLSSLLHVNDLALAFRSHTVAMWENEDAMSRAFIVHSAQAASDAQALAVMERPDFQPNRFALLASASPREPQPGADGSALPDDRVTVTSYESDRVEITAETKTPGYLILADTWYPGWEATVDGTSVPVLRADYIFRAVPIEPGAHRVSFEFHPHSFYLGALISGLGLLLCVVFLIVGGRHPPRAAGSSGPAP